MKLNQRKVALYAFLLVASGMGLMIDRLYSLPSAVGAAPAVRTSTGAPGGAEEEEVSGIGPPMAAVFESSAFRSPAGAGAKLGAVSPLLKDAFSMSAKMGERYDSKSARHQEEQERARKKDQEERQLVEAFSKSHRLMGVFVLPPNKWVVVNDRVLRIGDSLDGFALHRIEDYRALFRRGSLVVELELPRPTDAKVETLSPR